MLGIAAGIWFGTASLVAYRFRYPPFLAEGRTDLSGPDVPGSPDAPPTDPKTALGADFERVTLTLADGTTVAAWFVRGTRPHAGIVLLPPASGTRRTMLPWLKFLHTAGFSIIAPDSGDSAARGVDWGLHEREVAWASAAALTARGLWQVVALGVSEGAAAAILAQAERPTFRAIVADSPYANLDTMFRRVPALAGLHPAFVSTVIWEASLMLGRRLEGISPAAAARNLSGCSLMVIQNRGDELTTIADAQAIRTAAGPDAELWLVEAGGHADAIYEGPVEYATYVTDFLNRQLGGRAPAAAARRDSGG